MARASVTVSNCVLNSGVDISDTTTAGSTGTNGWNIASFDKSEIVILLKNDGGTTGAYQIKAPTTAGNYSTSKGIGDLSITVGGGVTKAVIVDSARFLKTDGSIDVDAVGGSTVGMTGSVRAFDPEPV